MKTKTTKSVTTTTEVIVTDAELEAIILKHLGMPKVGSRVEFYVSQDTFIDCTASTTRTAITNGDGE